MVDFRIVVVFDVEAFAYFLRIYSEETFDIGSRWCVGGFSLGEGTAEIDVRREAQLPISMVDLCSGKLDVSGVR